MLVWKSANVQMGVRGLGTGEEFVNVGQVI
jgi:hypothetical protein